jgi:hypothetical protein
MTKTEFLNSQLSIVRVKNQKVFNKTKDAYVLLNGNYLSVDGFGLVSFGEEKDGFVLPYSPIGGTSALKAILNGGGFTDYSTMFFVK